MRQKNYKNYLLKTIQDNYRPFIIGVLVVLIPLFIFSLKKITIKPFLSSFFSQNQTKPLPQTVKLSKKYYQVQEGEDLWSIAENLLGSGYYAFYLAKENNLSEPYILKPGQRLVIPTILPTIIESGTITATAASTMQKSKTPLTYIVKEGDYVYKIAEEIYGNGDYMSKLIIANNLSFPYNVEIGQKLLIPR